MMAEGKQRLESLHQRMAKDLNEEWMISTASFSTRRTMCLGVLAACQQPPCTRQAGTIRPLESRHWIWSTSGAGAGASAGISGAAAGRCRPLRVMQHGRCAHACPNAGATHAGGCAYARTAHHLPALVDSDTHAHRPCARTHAGADPATTHPHAHRHRADGDANANAPTHRPAASQQGGQRQGRCDTGHCVGQGQHGQALRSAAYASSAFTRLT